MDTEALRRRYRPDKIRVLLVGKSPPVGGTFFYAATSKLFRYTKTAFEQALDRVWPTDEAFLQFFRGEGFFLDDLCLQPVNSLPNPERRRARREGVGPLSVRLAACRPEAVLVTPKGMLPQVVAALRQSGMDTHPVALPFPAMSWQRAYVEGLARYLRERHR